MSLKPEISHMFRPEEKMIPGAGVLFVCARRPGAFGWRTCPDGQGWRKGQGQAELEDHGIAVLWRSRGHCRDRGRVLARGLQPHRGLPFAGGRRAGRHGLGHPLWLERKHTRHSHVIQYILIITTRARLQPLPPGDGKHCLGVERSPFPKIEFASWHGLQAHHGRYACDSRNCHTR